MTSAQCVNFIRMLLDDSRDHYIPLTEIVKTIDASQLSKLREAYQRQDERALRPFYAYAEELEDGDEIIDAYGHTLLYPRSCKLTYGINLIDRYGEQAQYLEYGIYQSVRNIEFAPGMPYPRAAYYTIRKAYNNGYKNYIEMSGYHTRAYLWFIRKPDEFTTTQALQLPAEYHPEVCVMAAEILNTIDAGEAERGDRTFQNQFLTIEGVGKLG